MFVKPELKMAWEFFNQNLLIDFMYKKWYNYYRKKYKGEFSDNDRKRIYRKI